MAAVIEAEFRYRQKLTTGEDKPAFDGMEEAASGNFEEESYTHPKYAVLNARTLDEAPSE